MIFNQLIYILVQIVSLKSADIRIWNGTKPYPPVRSFPAGITALLNTDYVQSSIFPNVPPYLKFRLYTDPPAILPPELSKHLPWVRTLRVVNGLINCTGLPLVSAKKAGRNWFGIFTGRAGNKRKPERMQIQAHQKYNILPSTEEICNKGKLWLNIYRYIKKFGYSEFPFVIESYAYPQEMFQFLSRQARSPDTGWIYKPSRQANCRGIFSFRPKWSELPSLMKPKPGMTAVIQRNISNSYTIQGKTLRYRVYVLVTSYYPLRVYLYNRGDTVLSLIYGLQPVVIPPESDVRVLENEELLQEWARQGYNRTQIQEKIEDAILKILFTTENKVYVNSKKTFHNRYNGYQLWTVDFIFDNTLEPLIMEFNRYVGLIAHYEPEASVKFPMITDTLNLVGHHFPPTLSLEAKEIVRNQMKLHASEIPKEITFNEQYYAFDSEPSQRRNHFGALPLKNRSLWLESILDDLEPGDVRELMRAEDELSRIGNFKRIFPTSSTHRYFKFIESNLYYYILQDAWEQRYGNKRKVGVELLTNFARKGFHLK